MARGVHFIMNPNNVIYENKSSSGSQETRGRPEQSNSNLDISANRSRRKRKVSPKRKTPGYELI